MRRAPSLRQGLRFLLGLAVSAVFVYFLAAGLEWELFIQNLVSTRPGYLLLALAFLAMDYCLRLYRWHWMLRAVGSPAGLARCARPFLIGFALNNLLPMRAGDIARAVAFRQTLGVPVASATATLLLERLLDLLVLLAILGISLAFLPDGNNLLAKSSGAGPVVVAVVIFAVVAAITLGLAAGSRAAGLKRSASKGDSLLFRARDWLRKLGEVLIQFSRLRLIGPLAALSIAIWLLEAGVFVAVAWSLYMDTAACWLAMGLGNLGTLLPGSPGHIGTFDFFTMTGMMVYGASRTLAASFAVLVHILLWLPLTTAGVLLMLLPAPTLWETTSRGDPGG